MRSVTSAGIGGGLGQRRRSSGARPAAASSRPGAPAGSPLAHGRAPRRSRPIFAVLVDVAHRHLGIARVGAQRRGQPRGEQRVAAQVGEEIGVAPDRLAGEQLRQRGEQRRLRPASRGRSDRRSARPRRTAAGRLQRLAVDLAGGQARHLVPASRSGPAPCRAAGWPPSAARMRGDLPAAPPSDTMKATSWSMPSSLRSSTATVPMPGCCGQHRLDLAQLDAEAADLDLVVGAAQALHLAVGRRCAPGRRCGTGARRARRVAQGLARNFSAVSSGRPR